MKTLAGRCGRNDGTAFIALIIIVLLVSVGTTMLMTQAKQQTYTTARVRDYLSAQAYAEAGANEAYNKLKTNFAICGNDAEFPMTTYADGTYDATVTQVSSNQAAIVCVGTRGVATAWVKLDAINYNPGTSATPGTPGSPPDPNDAFGYAVVSGGLMTWSGSGVMDIGGGKIHTNNKYKMVGSQEVIGDVSSCVQIWLTGTTKITGDAAAPVIKASGAVITGSQTVGPVPAVSIPDIDLTPYYNEASANGQVYSGNQHFTGSADLVIPGGIMWVNGNFKYSGSGQIIGCVIATGDIDISGSGDQIKVNEYPAVVARDGEIDISGSGKFHGLLYSGNGGFDKSGSGDVTGSIMTKGEFDKSGSWSLMAYENSVPVGPGTDGTEGTEGTEGDLVGVSAWQR